MDHTIAHADIFFFISTIGFISIAVLLIIALVYLISLFRSITKVAKKIEDNAETISEEAKDFVLDLRNSPVLSFLFGRKRAKKSVHGK